MGLILLTLLHLRRSPDFIIGTVERPYLRRWWLIPRNRIFNVYLHHFLRSDDDRALHDHPWANISILLRGRYLEHQATGAPRLRQAPALVPRRPTSRHRIELVDGPVWTLFLTGPWRRNWGFWCEGVRFVPWQTFTAPNAPGEIGVGCGEIPKEPPTHPGARLAERAGVLLAWSAPQQALGPDMVSGSAECAGPVFSAPLASLHTEEMQSRRYSPLSRSSRRGLDA